MGILNLKVVSIPRADGQPVNGCPCCIDEWVDSDGTRKETEDGRKRSKTLC